MVKDKTMRKKDKKQTQRKLRKSLGTIADVVQIIQFLWSISKPILAKAAVVTALVGGTVIVGKTIVHKKIDIPKKNADTDKAIIEPTLLEEKTLSITPQSVTPTSITPIIMADMGWGHITQDSTIAAFYMLIHNTGTEDDCLIGGNSEMCGRIGLQDMSTPGNGHEGDDVPFSVVIPTNSTAELKFFGRRILCHDVGEIGLGDYIPLTLIFEKHDEITIMVEIRKPLASWPTPGPKSPSFQ